METRLLRKKSKKKSDASLLIPLFCSYFDPRDCDQPLVESLLPRLWNNSGVY